MKYLIVIEPTASGFSAYSPDLPGCISTGKTEAEVQANMHDAIEFHLEGLKIEGYPIPQPLTASAYIEIAA
jgi:predicted RNase H-like HicB family nuclease